VPQFVLVAGSDVFCGIAQLEFFYGEAPTAMRSICSAFSFLALPRKQNQRHVGKTRCPKPPKGKMAGFAKFNVLDTRFYRLEG